MNSSRAVAAPSLFDPAPACWTVWYRPGPRVAWEQVGEPGTHAEAVGLIGAGGSKGGDWLVTDRPGQPN